MPSRELTDIEKQIKSRFIEAMYMCIGRRIVKTKVEFAEQVGMLPTNISRLETLSNTSVSAHNLAALCKLGINAEWLLLGKGNMFK